jgi:DNA-binding NarL/FixJ family response regulator
MPGQNRRLILVEDEPLMSSLLATSLSAANFIVETASDAASARKLIQSFDPDIALLDISLGDGPTGVHLAHAIRTTRPDIAILMLSKHPDAKSANADGLDLPGGVGFLRKIMVSNSEYLISAIEKVLGDKSEEVRQDKIKIPTELRVTGKGLQILKLIAEGYNNAEIAARSGLSLKSVEGWIERIYLELEIEPKGKLNPRVEATRRYFLSAGFPERKAEK